MVEVQAGDAVLSKTFDDGSKGDVAKTFVNSLKFVSCLGFSYKAGVSRLVIV